jgi:Bifunctional DNA primase/polymerase, N-terminal
MNTVLRAALEYQERDWNVIALRRDKRPAWHVLEETRGTNEWKCLHEEPAEPAELQRWWEIDPNAGVGIILGPGHDVVDVDHLDVVGVPEFRNTPTAQTPRPGLHYHVKSNVPLRSHRFDWGELRVEGDVCAMPPTTDDYGIPYRWVIGPDEAKLVELPESLVQLARKPHVVEGAFLSRVCISRADLRHADTREDVSRRLLEALGGPQDVVLGRNFRCVLHDDRHASAELYRLSDGTIAYHCWAGCCGDSGWLTFASVHARQSGRQGHIGHVERALWKLDLLVRAGLVEPVVLDAPDAPLHLRVVWRGFLRLLSLRWLTTPGSPTPFARSFAAPWCGLSEHEIRVGFHELCELGFVRSAGRDPRGLALWLPEGVRPID